MASPDDEAAQPPPKRSRRDPEAEKDAAQPPPPPPRVELNPADCDLGTHTHTYLTTRLPLHFRFR
jgi:heterogeneous nuclear ribonucleoprotein U-like protein 1